jgi:hypothetical protein
MECQGLNQKQAAVWLIRTSKGRAWARQHGGQMREMVDDLVEASADAAAKINARREATKQHEAPMSSTATILKTARRLGEAGVFAVIQKYADSVRLPNETSAQAFTRIFLADTAESQALRYLHSVAKGVDEPSGFTADPDERDDADGDDAMDELERLAAEERRRDPSLTRAKAFTRVFVDPANASLAKRERMQSMRKIGVRF